MPATSVADFLEKYCKPDRYRGRGEEYAKTVLESHEHATRAYGYDIISRHESVTGEAVYWYPAQSWPEGAPVISAEMTPTKNRTHRSG